jgi:hypothetical protein
MSGRTSLGEEPGPASPARTFGPAPNQAQPPQAPQFQAQPPQAPNQARPPQAPQFHAPEAVQPPSPLGFHFRTPIECRSRRGAFNLNRRPGTPFRPLASIEP